MKNDRFRLGICTVPCGKLGDWSIEEFDVSRKDAAWSNIRNIRSRVMHINEGRYKRLVKRGSVVVMSNTPMEIRTNAEAYYSAEGRVLISGLGMGMLLEAVLSKPEVTRVKVIEIDADLISLVGPHFKDDRLTIVNADAYTYKPGDDDFYDYAWHDIWNDMSCYNLPLMAKLTRKWRKPRVQAQGCWGRDVIREQEARYNRSMRW